ncbi:hypothetical protein EHM94_18205 [Marinobacter sp. NP-6]|uniref:hypothetical protein n=1 Tax=Marinobacter sp. NP-6 TaxID=2488666 RepID=UPI000FCC139F|nr:hypothetical protein [Marinobacter sp. NP-6]RUT76962.1 hypothetical protein EHM94_18205 [Marinobacter sp. NP-6]
MMFITKQKLVGCVALFGLFMLAQAALAADGQAVESLTQALEECERAQDERVAKRPTEAKIHIQRFNEKRDLALDLDPAVADDEKTAEQISRCDRLSSIVERSVQSHEQQRASIENVVEESNLYVHECRLAVKRLKTDAVDERSLLSARQALDRAQEHKESLQGEWRAFSVFQSNPEHRSKVVMARNLEDGDHCMESAGALINTKRQELEIIANELEPLSAKVQVSQRTCEQARETTTYSDTESNLQDAQALLLRAQAQEKELLDELRGSRTLSAYNDSALVKKLNSDLTSFRECVSEAQSRVTEMAESVQRKRRQVAEERAAQEKAQVRASNKTKAPVKEPSKTDFSKSEQSEPAEIITLNEKIARIKAEAEAEAKARAERLARERADKARSSPWGH